VAGSPADVAHGPSNEGRTESGEKLSRGVTDRVVDACSDREIEGSPERADRNHQHEGDGPLSKDDGDAVARGQPHSEDAEGGVEADFVPK
jgi:hypothetical protein